MVASINHDIKNPIITSLYLIGKLKSKINDNNHLNELDLLYFNLEFTMNLLNGFLDYTQFISGEFNIIKN